jgi:hypothetical protein
MTNKVSPIRPSEPEPDEFDAIMRRFLVAVAQLETVVQALGDLSELPKQFMSAGLVLQETTRDLNSLYDDLDGWAVKREHVLREVAS